MHTSVRRVMEIPGMGMALVMLGAGVAFAANPQPEAAATDRATTLIDMLMTGGVMIWPLLALSVVGSILAIHALLATRIDLELPARFPDTVRSLLSSGRLDECKTLCRGQPGAMAAIMSAGLHVPDADHALISAAMQAEGSRQAGRLGQRVAYLMDVAMVAPLLGILGTVWGLLKAFSGLHHFDQTAQAVILEGMATVMITTFVGLAIAIPALVVAAIVRDKVRRLVSALEVEATALARELTEAKRRRSA